MKEKYEKLYSRIPAFKCKSGCTDCCNHGLPLFSPWEMNQIPKRIMATGIECPYKGDGKCNIYEHRGFVCRLFGSAQGWECQHGCQPDKPLTYREARDLRGKFFSLFQLVEEQNA